MHRNEDDDDDDFIIFEGDDKKTVQSGKQVNMYTVQLYVYSRQSDSASNFFQLQVICMCVTVTLCAVPFKSAIIIV